MMILKILYLNIVLGSRGRIVETRPTRVNLSGAKLPLIPSFEHHLRRRKFSQMLERYEWSLANPL